MCVNATGTCKLPPVVTESSKNPRCFNELEMIGICNYHKTLKTDIVMSMCNLFSNLNLKDGNVNEMLTTMGFGKMLMNGMIWHQKC